MTIYKYDSADNHLDQRWVPRNLWQDRVAARLKDQAPSVIDVDGFEFWSWEDEVAGGRDGGAAGPNPENIVSLSNIADDGKGRTRDHAGFE